ncbi:hypothetical protein ACEPAF_1161 [Sanghuangporus sanghuang]
MPAARPLKRRASPSPGAADPTLNHSFQLTFASPSSIPSELPSTQPVQGSLGLQTTISFAPNVTPGTFSAPPSDDVLLGGESAHPTLFPDASGIEEGTVIPSVAKRRRKTTPASASRATPIPSKAGTRKSGKAASFSRPASPPPDSKAPITANSTDAPAHIPRPPNAFILFRSSFIRSQHVSAETEGNHGTLSKIVGMLWHALSYEERQVWQAKARRAYAEHKRMYPGYSFRPAKDKTSSSAKSERDGTPTSSVEVPPTKRKTRAVGPRDLERCEHIAALLARGLKGAELDAAVKEFDAARTPQTFTPRFEAPITAQTYAAVSKDKIAKENQIKKEAEDDVKTKRIDEDSGKQIPEEIEKMTQAVQYEQQQVHLPLAVAHAPPRRVRRSSSAPLLDAGLPISAPAPLYPVSSHANFFHSQTPGPFEYSQQQRNSIFGYDPSAQHGQHQQQTYAGSFGYSQHTHEGLTLRKRSASSSPPLRRPSYSYSHAQAHTQPFGHAISTPYSHQQEPQPFMQAYGGAHPHLQRMQAQMQAQSQARVQHHQDDQSVGVGLGLNFDQGYQANYNTQQQQGGSLSRQSTLTDISSDDSSNTSNTGGSGFWNESVDFNGFSFTGSNERESQTPISAHPSNPNSFDVPPLSAAPSSATVDELDYTYADMPGLVDAPPYQNFYQAPPQSRPQHPHLEIQTSWTSEEFTFEHAPASAASVPPSSALDVESVPPSAVDGSFEFPPPNSVLNGYMTYSTQPQSQSAASTVSAPTPCSPTSQSASGAPSSVGARTPIDDTAFSAWDQSSVVTTAAAVTSPVSTYDSSGSTSVDNEAVAREHALALQAGFRTYLAHAEKIGAIESGASEATFEQFVRFVREQQKMRSGTNVGVGGGMKGMNGFSVRMPEPYTQMAHVILLSSTTTPHASSSSPYFLSVSIQTLLAALDSESDLLVLTPTTSLLNLPLFKRLFYSMFLRSSIFVPLPIDYGLAAGPHIRLCGTTEYLVDDDRLLFDF